MLWPGWDRTAVATLGLPLHQVGPATFPLARKKASTANPAPMSAEPVSTRPMPMTRR
jgi:hypothetical protein